MSDAELVVFDQEEPCPYLPDRTARMPLRAPSGDLTRAEFDRKLFEGDRRAGEYLYRTHCPTCSACQPIRLDVATFRPRRTQRRQWNLGQRLLRTEVVKPKVDPQRVALFNRHRRERGLSDETREISAFGYENFLVETCGETLEIDYYCEGRLVGVAIFDQGKTSLSAVYCFYDPSFRRVSLGVYSVLWQVELCRQGGMRYLYLGYYVAQSPHMSYKALYRPHERLVDGRWVAFD